MLTKLMTNNKIGYLDIDVRAVVPNVGLTTHRGRGGGDSKLVTKVFAVCFVLFFFVKVMLL